MATSPRRDLTPCDFVSDMNRIALYALSNGAPFFAYKHFTFLAKYIKAHPEQAECIIASFTSKSHDLSAKIMTNLLPAVRIPAFVKLSIMCAVSAISVLEGIYSGILYILPALMTKNVRSIPPLITALVVIFLTSDAWRILGTGSGWRLSLLMVAFLLASLFFIVRKDYWADLDVPEADREILLRKVACRSSVNDLINQEYGPVRIIKPTELGGRGIILVTYLIYALLSLLAVTVSVFLSLVAVGIILINANETKMLADSVTVVWVIHGSFVMTAQLLSISFSLSIFAAFFLVAGQSKEDRQEFMRHMLSKLRTVLIIYSVYCRAYAHAARWTRIADNEAEGLDAQTSPPPHGRPTSWAAVAIIITGFIVGGIAMIPGPDWWLFWTGTGIVIVGGIYALSSHILNDWY